MSQSLLYEHLITHTRTHHTHALIVNERGYKNNYLYNTKIKFGIIIKI